MGNYVDKISILDTFEVYCDGANFKISLPPKEPCYLDFNSQHTVQ